MKRLLFGLLILTLLGVGVYGVWRKTSGNLTPETSESAVADITPGRPATALAAARKIKFAITAAGEIGPLDSVSVRPEVGGLIAKLALDIGDKVKRGDVLFELDDKGLQTEKTSRQTEIAGAQLAVQTQTLLLEKSKRNFQRVHHDLDVLDLQAEAHRMALVELDNLAPFRLERPHRARAGSGYVEKQMPVSRLLNT